MSRPGDPAREPGGPLGLHQGLADGHLVPVEPIEAFHAHAGAAELRRLHQGADALQGTEDGLEGVLVAGWVGLKEGRSGQRARAWRRGMPGRTPWVAASGEQSSTALPPPGPPPTTRGRSCSVWPLEQFDGDGEVGDEDAGYSHGSGPWAGNLKIAEQPFYCQADDSEVPTKGILPDLTPG